MESARQVKPDVHILPSFFPVPGFGVLPVNAFVLTAKEPALVDAGLHQDKESFLEQLESVIAADELRWLLLTHPDQDHVGSLEALMARAPAMRLVTTYLGYGILSLFAAIPLERVYFLNPGESLDLGDRTMTALRPPTFDNPATNAFYDAKSDVLFSSDCFGAVLSEPASEANAIEEKDLAQGQLLWTTVDAPWLHNIDPARYASELARIANLAPETVLSAHLPPAMGMTDRLLKPLAEAPASAPFVGPNQAALEAMLAAMSQRPAPVSA